MTVKPRKGKGVYGYLAPCVLKSVEKAPVDDHSGDVVLLSVWRTRCSKPRTDLIIWDPKATADKSITLVDGKKVGNFLGNRFCDFQAQFDVEKALRQEKSYNYAY